MKRYLLTLILFFISYLSYSQLFKYVYDLDKPNYVFVDGFTGTLHLANNDTVFGYIQYSNEDNWVTVENIIDDSTTIKKAYHFSKIAHFYLSTDSHIINHNYFKPIKYRKDLNCFRIIDNRKLVILRLEWLEQINSEDENSNKRYIVHQYFIFDRKNNELIPIDSFRKDLYPLMEDKKKIIDTYIAHNKYNTTDNKIKGQHLLKIIHYYNSLY